MGLYFHDRESALYYSLCLQSKDESAKKEDNDDETEDDLFNVFGVKEKKNDSQIKQMISFKQNYQKSTIYQG